MNVNTPHFIEQQWKLRFSLHLFRWGVHLKVLRSDVFRHFVIKATKGAAFGRRYGRRLLYVGWWQSRKGVKQHLNGWRIALAFDRLPESPRENMNIPFFPRKANRRPARTAGSVVEGEPE